MTLLDGVDTGHDCGLFELEPMMVCRGRAKSVLVVVTQDSMVHCGAYGSGRERMEAMTRAIIHAQKEGFECKVTGFQSERGQKITLLEVFKEEDENGVQE